MTNQPSSTSHQLPSSWVEALFDRMLLNFGKRFTDQWGSADPDKLYAHWARELSGYSREELARGAAALEARDWPPTLPDFKRMCRPPIDPLVAYYEAVEGVVAREKGEMGKWSHPAIFWASTPLAYDLQNMTYKQIETRWNKALQDQLEKGEWAPIPQAAMRLEAPGVTKKDKEEAAKTLQQIGATGALSPKNDHLRWAKRIVEKAKQANHGLSPIQVQFAKEALGVA